MLRRTSTHNCLRANSRTNIPLQRSGGSAASNVRTFLPPLADRRRYLTPLQTILKRLLEVKQHLAHVALVVREYDEAIDFYTKVLKFRLVEDTYVPEQDKRWVLVAPPNTSGCMLLLARATSDDQRAAIGNQAGGRVFLFLYTDDFHRDYQQMVDRGVNFVRKPKTESYGTVAVFEDLYGNLWDLLQPSDSNQLNVG